MKLKLLLIFIFTLALNAETLNDILNSAIKTNPDVNKQLKYYDSVIQDLEIAKSGNLPTLDYQGSIGKERTKDEGSSSVDLTHYNNSITLKQNIFNGYKTTNEIKQNKARISSAAYSVIDKTNVFTIDTIKAYLEVLKENELTILYNENVKNHIDILNKIKEKTDAGIGRQSEVQQTNSRLSLANANLIVQQNNYQDTLTNYLFHVGRHFDENEYIVPTIKYNFPKTIDEATNIALNNNPKIKIMRSNIIAKQAEYNKDKSNFYPIVDAVITQDWTDNLNGSEGKSESTNAYLSIKYNFYRGGSDEAQKLKSMSYIKEENEVLNRTIRDIIKATRLSYMAYKTYEEQIKFLYVHVNASEETLNSYVDEYGLGRRDLLAILDAQKEYNTARQTYTKAKYDLLISQYKLLGSMNELVNQFNLDIEKKVNLNIIKDIIFNDNKFSKNNICDNSLNQTTLNQYGCENSPKVNIGYLIQEEPKEIEEPKIVSNVKLKNIHFAGSSTKISSYSMTKLEENINKLKNINFKMIELYAYTDNTETIEKNLSYSKKRLKETMTKMIQLGIEKDKIKTFAMGKTNYIADNSTKKGRLLNRRIEFKVIY